MRSVYLLPLVLAITLAAISRYAPLGFPPPYSNRVIESDLITAVPSPREGVFEVNEILRDAPGLFKNKITEPDGGMFLFTLDGIYRAAPDGKGSFSDPVKFVEVKNGRPLSGAFDEDWNLYFCDTQLGLGKLNMTDRSYQILIGNDQIPFCDDIEIALTGEIFIADATDFSPPDKNSLLVASLAALVNGGAYGRVLKYIPRTGKLEVLVKNITFANGIELAPDESYLLYSDANICSTKKYWLKGAKKGEIETFLQMPLPGFSDGISKGSNSTYWLAIFAPVDKTQLLLLSTRLTRWLLYRIPISITESLVPPHGAVAQVDERGKVLRSFDDTSGAFGRVTSIKERDGKIYIGSFNNVVKVLDLNQTAEQF